jgi:hypothetical protein
LPALTICAEKHHFARKNILEKISNNDSNSGPQNKTEILNFLNKLNIREQFKALLSAEEIFNESCLVLKTNGLKSAEEFVHCQQISPIRMSISFDTTCFTILSQLNGEQNDLYLINRNKFNSLYALISIYFPNYVNFIYLFVHSRSETIHSIHEKSHTRITHNESEVLLVDYKKTSVELMKKPYSTSCENYNQFGYNLRSDCIFECITNNLKKELNLWYSYYLINDSESDLLMTQKTNFGSNLSLEQKCEKICGLDNDCVKEYFISEYIREAWGNQSFIIVVRPQRYPILSIKHSPKLQFEEFMCYITSIMSLWFGFSVIMLSNVCSLILKKLILVFNYYNICNYYKSDTTIFKRKTINNALSIPQKSQRFRNRLSNT